MIYFVTGEPGAGKSMLGVANMIDDLVHDSAYVVTNEVLCMSQLRAYVSAKRIALGIDDDWELDANLKWMPSEDVFEFWRHRSGGLVLESSPDRVTDEEEKRKRMPKDQFNAFMDSNFKRMLEKPEFQRPVHYYISETADYFDSQEWQTTGRAVKWYARKHRHLHDNVYFTAHNADDVELRLRNLCSENIDMVNQNRMSVGIFRARPVIKANHYFKMKGGSKKPFRVVDHHIDKAGVGACYNTAGALGVHDKPEVNRNKGKLPYWTMWAAGVVGVLALLGTFLALPFFGGRAAGRMASGMGVSTVSQKAGLGSAIGQTVPQGDTARPVETLRPRNAKELTVTGILVGNGRLNISLSDGTTRTEDDGTIDHIYRSAVKFTDLGLVRIMGAGVKVTPDRPGGVPPAEAVAVSPSGVRSGGMSFPTPPQGQPSLPFAPYEDGSAWVVGRDGVSRLRERVTLPPTVGR